MPMRAIKGTPVSGPEVVHVSGPPRVMERSPQKALLNARVKTPTNDPKVSRAPCIQSEVM